MAARNAAYVPPAATPPPRTTQRGLPDNRKTVEEKTIDPGFAETLPPVSTPHHPAATAAAKANAAKAPASPPRQTIPHGGGRPSPSPPRAHTPARGVPVAPQPWSAPRPPAAQPARPSGQRPRSPSGDDLALTTTAPMAQPHEHEGPSSLGAPLADDEPAFATTTPHRRSDARDLGLAELLEEDHEPPRRSNRVALFAGLGVLALGLLVGGVMLARRGPSGGGRAKEAYDHSRALFLSDTDDAFRRSAELLQQAHGADESNPLVLAGLAEVHATWAWYLREDARELEAASGKAVEAAYRNLRRV
jgi:hypothetical protein